MVFDMDASGDIQTFTNSYGSISTALSNPANSVDDATTQDGGLIFDGTRYVYSVNDDYSLQTYTALVAIDPVTGDLEGSPTYTDHPLSQLAALATDGNQNYLVAYVQSGSTSGTVRYWMFNSALAASGSADVLIDDVGTPMIDPLAQPVSAVWDGAEYLVAYEKVVGGQNQPFVQRVSASGSKIGAPDPIAPVGSSIALAPMTGGAVAAWIDASGRVQSRMLKYR